MANKRRLPEVRLPLPSRPLGALCCVSDLAAGEHPSLLRAAAALHEINPFRPLEEELPANLPLALTVNGHHTVRDAGYLAAAGGEDSWPLAPLFVRDLAGRVIHTGLNPLPQVPDAPLMPVTCRLVPQTMPGADMLETVFLTSFRCLEWAYGPGTTLTGHTDVTMHAVYPAPHLYPYKLRVDSFYQDGFRLPQVERLFVMPAEQGAAEKAGQLLLERWQKRPQGQGYEQFHEANNGETWFEELFRQGCTVVPTFEGYNGYFKVTADFGMEDVWPGCVVEGLHEVLDYKADASPAGTILEVIRPGYATAAGVVPAQVVASDGSGYVSPHAAGPQPLLPDRRLPHSRLHAEADCWLPIHPLHFEIPALWDWSTAGHFQQVAGPLWDPLHYAYTSVPKIIKAFRHGWEQNPKLAEVPEDMRPRFHPVCALTTYDTISTRTAEFRSRQPLETPLSGSAIDTVPLLREVSPKGYHPLPEALEYELDAFAFPELSPRHHKHEDEAGLAPVISSTVTVKEAQKLLVAHPEPVRRFMLRDVLYLDGDNKPWQDYPQLARYRPQSPLPKPPATFGFCYLPDLPTSQLMINVKRFFGSKAYRTSLDAINPALYDALFAFREEALSWRRLRHRLARKYAGWYLSLWWQQHNPSTVHDFLRDKPEEYLMEAELLLHSQPGAEKEGE